MLGISYMVFLAIAKAWDTKLYEISKKIMEMRQVIKGIAELCRKIHILVWVFLYLLMSALWVLLGSVFSTSACKDTDVTLDVIIESIKVGMLMWATIHGTVFGLTFLIMVIISIFYKGKSQ